MLVEEEVDYRSGGTNPLEFRRYYYGGGYYVPGYRALGQRTGGFTRVWSHSYASVVYANAGVTGIAATVLRPDGTMWHFDSTGAETFNRGGGGGANRIHRNSDGSWTLTLADSDVEQYDSAGRLRSITTRAGLVTTVNYDANGRIANVSDAFGKTLVFGYDTDGRLATITDPAGGVIAYSYQGTRADGTEVLAGVTYPDGSARTYAYQAVAHHSLLTGITDERNQLYATYSYDAFGRLTTSSHAGGADQHSFNYQVPYRNDPNPVTAVTDSLGTVRTYTMTSVGGVYRTSSIIGGPCADCGGDTASMTYDGNGNIATRTDFNNNVTSYTYDLSRNLEISRTDRIQTIRTTWDPNFRLPATVVEPNLTTTYTRDGRGNALTRTDTDTSVTPNVSRVWTYTYDGWGRILTVKGPRTDVDSTVTYAYYECSTGFQCGELRSVTNALNQKISFDSYNAHGQPLSVTDENGNVIALSYDARQRVVSQTIAGETTTFEYWPTGLTKKVTLPDGSFLSYEYDGAHRLTRIADGLGDQIVYELDAMGHRTAEHVYDPASSLARAHTRVFNSLGQLYEEIDSAGTDEVSTVFGYDGNGNLTSANEPMGRHTTDHYDARNRLVTITDPAHGTTSLGYDASDNLTSISDPNGLTTGYFYDGYTDLTRQVSADSGTTINTYDAGSNLVTSTDARGSVTTYSYDALDRVTGVSYSNHGNADQALSLTYDNSGLPNSIGRLSVASDQNVTLGWEYDQLGRVTKKTQSVVAAAQLSVRYGYSNGNLASVTTPSGQVISYTYANHRISGVTINNVTTVSQVAYSPFGQAASWRWGNGTSTARTFNSDGLITGIAGPASFTYVYNPDRTIQSVTRDEPDTYSTLRGYTVAIDGASNRISSLDVIDADETVAYSYDAAGHLLADGTRVFTYNNAGRLSSVTVNGSTTTYTYNALGQRVKKSGAGGITYFVYDERRRLVGEYDGNQSLVEEIVWMDDIPVASIRPAGGGGIGVFYIHTDLENAPTALTRADDNVVVWRWDHDVYGNGAANEDSDGNGQRVSFNLRFPGQYYDAESGLTYNYFRDYDAATGRYVESDPIGLEGGIDTYAYSRERPNSRIDPNGLFSFTMDFSSRMVDSLPRRRGEWPGGRTTYTAHTRCDCAMCGGAWRLSSCSAGAAIRVDLLTGVSDPAEAAFYSNGEAQHVADFTEGEASVRQAGEVAEQSVRAKPFGSKFSCESFVLDVVSKAVYAELKRINDASQAKYDDSGLHHWKGAPWRMVNPKYWF